MFFRISHPALHEDSEKFTGASPGVFAEVDAGSFGFFVAFSKAIVRNAGAMNEIMDELMGDGGVAVRKGLEVDSFVGKDGCGAGRETGDVELR